MKIKNITVKELFALESGLFLKYSSEAKSSTVNMNINPNEDMYTSMENANVLDVIGLFKHDKLIGFSIIISMEMPHYSSLATTVESIFIDKDYRKFNGFSMMLHKIKQIAKDKGSINLFVSTPTNGTADKVLSGMKDFKNISKIYSMDLT